MSRKDITDGFRTASSVATTMAGNTWQTSHSGSLINDHPYPTSSPFDNANNNNNNNNSNNNPFSPSSSSMANPFHPAPGPFNPLAGMPRASHGSLVRPDAGYPTAPRAVAAGGVVGGVGGVGSGTSQTMSPMPPSGPGFPSRTSSKPTNSPGQHYGLFGTIDPWDRADGYSPPDSVDDIIASPNLSDYPLDMHGNPASPGGKNKPGGNERGKRRPSNRDEFDGPHQYLQRPPPEYIALQERELPHLPTHLQVQEQDSVLSSITERLSQCAFDFVAKYQFPIPLTSDMRPVERAQDREWTEWVYLLKRLATKRRIPARVLYNGQIKQFVTILENSLEMRQVSKHQSRPLKDDRNILQLISAGIQVAKILKDAQAMVYLDHLYVETEKNIQERTAQTRLFRSRTDLDDFSSSVKKTDPSFSSPHTPLPH